MKDIDDTLAGACCGLYLSSVLLASHEALGTLCYNDKVRVGL